MRTELQEGITMDFKKFITDLAAIYRMPTARTPVGPIVDVDAVHEVGRKAGHEAGHAEGYEAGRKAGYEAGRTEAPPNEPRPKSSRNDRTRKEVESRAFHRGLPRT